MDKEQNLNKKDRYDYVQEVAQEARNSIAQLFSKKHLKTKEVIFALAGICGAMTEEVSLQEPGVSTDEVKEKFLTIYEAYLSLEK